MGQMNAPLFEIDQPGLTLEVNSYVPGLGLAWPQLFPLKYTPKFDLKGIEGDEGIPVSADRVAFNTKAPKKTRKKVGSWSGTLGKIEISREKDEIQINEYTDLQAIAAASDDPATAQHLVDLAYDDIKFCGDGMDYRVEIDAMRIGSRGKQVLTAKIDGDMAEQDEINFNVPEENFIGVATKWDNAETADGLGDIMKGQKIVAKKGGRKPQYAIMEQAAFDLLCAQKKTIKRVAGVVMKAVGLESIDDVDVDTINRYMRKKKAPQILIIDTYATIEDKYGSQETIKPWNENVCTLSAEPRLGYTYFKPVPMLKGTDALQTQGSYYKMTVYSDVNPMLEVTMSEAYVQPALTGRKSLVFINTMATTWNDGDTA